MRSKDWPAEGFAFISMSNLADAEEILAVKHQIDGRHVDVKPALPKGTAQTGVEGGYEHMVHQQKLFVAGLSQTTEASDLSSAFSSFGKVRDARIMLDRVSSTSRGFGFVEFEDSSVVLRLLKELPEVVCDGRLVEFKLALPKNSQSYSVQHARYPAPNTFRRIPGRFRGRHMNGYDTMGGGIVYTQYPFMGPVFRSPSESSSMLYGGIPMVTYDGHRSEPIHMTDVHNDYAYLSREGAMMGPAEVFPQGGMLAPITNPNAFAAGSQPYTAYEYVHHASTGMQYAPTDSSRDVTLHHRQQALTQHQMLMQQHQHQHQQHQQHQQQQQQQQQHVQQQQQHVQQQQQGAKPSPEGAPAEDQLPAAAVSTGP